jgi:hypothetical protein
MWNFSSKVCFWAAGLGVSLLGGGVAVADEVAVHQERGPWTLSFVATGTGPIPAPGLELAYQLSERVAVAAHVGSLMLHNEAGLKSRLFFVNRPGWGLYAGANVQVWLSPLLSAGFTPVVSGELGSEWRWPAGYRFGLGLGMAGYYGACTCWSGNRQWQPIPVANLRFGKSW